MFGPLLSIITVKRTSEGFYLFNCLELCYMLKYYISFLKPQRHAITGIHRVKSKCRIRAVRQLFFSFFSENVEQRCHLNGPIDILYAMQEMRKSYKTRTREHKVFQMASAMSVYSLFGAIWTGIFVKVAIVFGASALLSPSVIQSILWAV